MRTVIAESSAYGRYGADGSRDRSGALHWAAVLTSPVIRVWRSIRSVDASLRSDVRPALCCSSISKPTGGRALFIIGADGKGQRQLTPWTLGAHGTPDWSAAGLIVFRAVQDEESGIGNLSPSTQTAPVCTRSRTSSTRSSATRSGSPPTGNGSSSARGSPAGAGDVFLCKTDGTDLHPVTQTPLEDSSPDWTKSTS